MKQLTVKNTQAGFTLIELVVVIVILGILAVTAAPKFIDIQEDARTATLNAVKASMQSASTIVHSKALIAGNESTAAATVTVNGSSVAIVYGYPKATTADWAQLLDVNTADFTTALIASSIVVHPTGRAAPSAISDTVSSTNNCYAYYTEAATGGVPTIKVVNCL